jgi:hypothetical protein
MSRDRKTTRLADRQRGLLTTKQAASIGWTSSSIERAVSAGRIDHPEPNVIRIGGADGGWHQRLLAACMTSGGYAIDRAGAALYELEGFSPRWVEVIVRRWERRPNQSVHIRESQFLTDADVTVVKGIPCVTIEFLLVHLGATVPSVMVEDALDDALRRGLTTPERIWAVMERVAKPGVRGVGVIRPLLLRRLGTSGRRSNGFEKKVYRVIEKAGLPLPVAQLEIRDVDFLAFADWAYPAYRVLIECVSVEYHSGLRRTHADITRRNRVVNLDYEVLEFTYEHATVEQHVIVRDVSRALERNEWRLA